MDTTNYDLRVIVSHGEGEQIRLNIIPLRKRAHKTGKQFLYYNTGFT